MFSGEPPGRELDGLVQHCSRSMRARSAPRSRHRWNQPEECAGWRKAVRQVGVRIVYSKTKFVEIFHCGKGMKKTQTRLQL